jgi:hypothetical protein
LARKEYAEDLAARHGYGLVPPYEHPGVMAARMGGRPSPDRLW